MSNQKNQITESAVSPVVGVMLMLVVVIIIAAVVSAFAGGQAESTRKAPSASVDIWIETGDSLSDTEINFRHLGGDPIPTDDIQIITYFTNSSGHRYKHTQSASGNVSKMYKNAAHDARLPYLADISTGTASSNPETKDFGNFTFRTGDVMTTYNLFGMADLLGVSWTRASTFEDSTLDDPDLKPGSIIEVKILHTPSGKMILEKEVAFR